NKEMQNAKCKMQNAKCRADSWLFIFAFCILHFAFCPKTSPSLAGKCRSKELTAFVFLRKGIMGKQRGSQPQVGVIQVTMQGLLVDPLDYLCGPNQVLLGKDLMDDATPQRFIEPRIFGQELPFRQSLRGGPGRVFFRCDSPCG